MVLYVRLFYIIILKIIETEEFDVSLPTQVYINLLSRLGILLNSQVKSQGQN